jgi:hypothetical protein
LRTRVGARSWWDRGNKAAVNTPDTLDGPHYYVVIDRARSRDELKGDDSGRTQRREILGQVDDDRHSRDHRSGTVALGEHGR